MSDLDGFEIHVDFASSRATVTFGGDLDDFTGRQLEAILAVVVAGGQRHIICDLAECSFIDAAGLRVVAQSAERLYDLGGDLTIRSPSSAVRRLLDIVGPGDFRFAVQPAVTGLGREQSTQTRAAPRDPSPVELGAHFRTVASLPADDDVVDGALRLVVALARATVGGADGVSVSLRRYGHLSTVAASDATISAMDGYQYSTGEGPCVDASVEGRWFHSGSLATETRWAAFTPRARTLGINAILSSPLLAGERPVGALNIYSRRAGAFASKDQELAAVFAREASTILTDAGVALTDDDWASLIGAALESRHVIALAQGVMMEREGVTEHVAYAVLRRFSAQSGTPLRERAEEVISSARQAALDPSRGAADDDG